MARASVPAPAPSSPRGIADHDPDRQPLLPSGILDEDRPTGRGGGVRAPAGSQQNAAAAAAAAARHTADAGSLLEAFRNNSYRGVGAWSLQMLGFLFLALIWSLVLSKMASWPFSLPLFAWHPLLQSLGLVLLIQSTSVLQPTSGAGAEEKAAAAKIHRWLNLLAALLFTAGASVMWYLHSPGGHFISYHGILGASVVVWMWFQALLGAATVYPAGQKWLGGQARAKGLWKWHRLSGYLLLPAFLFTLFGGATQTTWAQQNSSTVYRVAITVVLLAIFAVGARRVQLSKLPKLV